MGPTATRFIRPVLVAAGLFATASLALADDGLRARLAIMMEALYRPLMARIGANISPGTPEWSAAVGASVDAVMAVRPADCAPADYGVDLCGVRPTLSVTTAMAPTMREGEAVMVAPYSEERPPTRGDVVDFAYTDPRGGRTRTMFRIIAIPGETIELRDGIVHIDGRPMRQEPTGETIPATIGNGRLQVFRETTPEGRSYLIARDLSGPPFGRAENAGPYTVPDDHILVLGDNRHNAVDSRYPDRIGGNSFIPVDAILGRVAIVYAAADRARIGTRLDPQ